MNRWMAVAWLGLAVAARPAELPLPARSATAEPGSVFARRITDASMTVREQAAAQAIAEGNVPGWLRRLEPVRLVPRRADDTNVVILFVAPDYLAIGSDEDWLWMPLSPRVAQRVADQLECSLPTSRMVDAIHRAAAVRLAPQPLPPGPEMITVGYFERHTGLVRTIHPRAQSGGFTDLIAGHKKDVVVSNRLPLGSGAPGRVAIYGWHRTNGVPIQPLYVGHAETWVDYSHGIRLISNHVLVNGRTNSLPAMLGDAAWAGWLSDEGVMALPRYPDRPLDPSGPSEALPPAIATTASAPAPASAKATLPAAIEATPFDWQSYGDEVWRRVDLAPDVRVMLSEPASIDAGKPVRLVIYALPNGSTIEQTVGRRPHPGDDWRMDVQHVGAQTRWLRRHDSGATWVVAYLEAQGLAWPAWRRRHAESSALVVRFVDAIAERYRTASPRIVLSGHSGGGSFIFGYLNGVTQIPDRIERMAFLDANYAYDGDAGHAAKLEQWLAGGTDRHLVVLAYQDYVALLDGKTFVSEAGGTWGRSQRMLADLGTRFPFTVRGTNSLSAHSALGGRVQFWLRENPERKIWHTVQVERNGFIHALVAGTALEERGYVYLGARVYEVR